MARWMNMPYANPNLRPGFRPANIYDSYQSARDTFGAMRTQLIAGRCFGMHWRKPTRDCGNE